MRVLLPVSARTIVVLLTLLSLPVQAQAENGGDHLLSEPTYNSLTEINRQIEAADYNGALNNLRQLQQDIAADDAYEQAVVDQTYGYVYNGLGRHNQAAEAFIRAVNSGTLPTDVSHKLTYLIAQLLAQTKDYQRALDYLQRWLAQEGNADTDAHRLAAMLYYHLQDYRGVIKHVRLVISKSKSVDESIYQLLLAAYFETKEYTQAADLLVTMLRLFPDNKEYWKQLAGSYQLSNQDSKALAVTEMAYSQGLLDSQETLNLARMYLSLEVPYRAARLLQEEINNGGIENNAENLRLLADSYYLAHETDAAIEAYGKAAAAQGDANLYFRLGQLLIQEQRWDEARGALQQAINNGNLEHRSMAYLYLGIAAFHLQDTKLARDALQHSSQSETTRAQAQYWLQRLDDGHAGS